MKGATDFLQEGAEVRPGLFLKAADFERGFADGCHHKKEEGILFQSLAAHGVPVPRGPTGVVQAGEGAARQEVSDNARANVGLLRGHISKEDRVLLPMADQVISQAEQNGVAEGFEKNEHEEPGQGDIR